MNNTTLLMPQGYVLAGKSLHKPSIRKTFNLGISLKTISLVFFGLFFYVNIQAQDNQGKKAVPQTTISAPVELKATQDAVTTDINSSATPNLSTNCKSCDGKILDATHPVYKLVNPGEIAERNSRARLKPALIQAAPETLQKN